MLSTMLEDLLSIPKEPKEIHLVHTGGRATFNESVRFLIKEYSRLNPDGNPDWIKLNNILNDKRKPYFSVLHVADKNSHYIEGTVILEVGPNEDIEINGSTLIPC